MPIQINNVPRRVVYAASGTGPYNFTFEILTASDIAVYRDNTLLTLTTNYTVTINANGTGYVTLTATPTGATQIAIVGNRTIQRLTDFVTGGDFFANTLNDELDQQTIFAQQNAEGLARALQAPTTDPTSINMTLPAAATRASRYLGFDASGNPAALTGTGSYTVINLAADVTGVLPVVNGGTGVTTSTGTGAVVRAITPNIEFSAGSVSTPSITTTGDLNTGIYFPAADTVAIATGGTNRVQVASNGNVGIGSSSPDSYTATEKLIINTTGDCSAVIQCSTNNIGRLRFANATASGYNGTVGYNHMLQRMFFDINGVGSVIEFLYDGSISSLGTYSKTVGATNRDLYVDNTGTIGYVTSIRASKTNIVDLVDIGWLYQLNPVSFNYRKKEDGQYTSEADGPLQFGLIAEDVEAVNPALCFYDQKLGEDPQLRGVSYGMLIAPLLKAVQKLQSELDAAKNRIAVLESSQSTM